MGATGFITTRFNRRRALPRSLKAMRAVAIGGVAVATATLIVTLAILTGFEREYRRAILDFNSHLVLLKAGEIPDTAAVDRIIDEHRLRDDDRDYAKRHTRALNVWRRGAHLVRAYERAHARASYDAAAGTFAARLIHAVRPAALYARVPHRMAAWISRMGDIEKKSIVGATPFIYREGLMIASGVIRGVVVKGVDPATLGNVNSMEIDLWDADSLAQALHSSGVLLPVIVGTGLARQLGIARSPLDTNDIRATQLTIMVPTTSVGGGADHFRTLTVVGTFESGLHDYDANFALMAIPEVARLFRMRGEHITGIELKLADPLDALSLSERLGGLLGPSWRAVPWSELNAEIFRAVKMEKLTFSVVMGILVIVAAFNIIGVLVLMIIMRRHELCVLRALGMTSRELTRVFVRGGVAIGAMGVAIGIVAGLCIAYLLKSFDLVRIAPEIYFLDRLPIDISPSVCGMIAVFCVGISWLTSRTAARKLADIPIVEGL